MQDEAGRRGITDGEAAGTVTPMMAQYLEIKAVHPDHLLFYRMGDFFELFFADAEVASRALGIALTKRGKHLGVDIPMAGVPVERAEDYMARLIAAGHKVALCEQLEDPAEARKRGSKAVVKRDVVRLVTPGTLTEETLLDARRDNYLLALARLRLSSAAEAASFGLAWVDISTGTFRVGEVDRAGLAAELARLDPGEVLVAESVWSDPDLGSLWQGLRAVTPLPRDAFDPATAERRLADFFAVATVDGFGPLSRAEVVAAAAVVGYVERTQLGKHPPLGPPVAERSGGLMAIDAATRANLELVRTMGGERAGSLLGAIDRTVTAAGSRLLARRIAAPLTGADDIRRRLDSVSAFVEDPGLRADLRRRLAEAPDLARALARLAVGRGGPRDLAAVRDALAAAREIAGRLEVGLLGEEIAADRAALGAVDPGLEAQLADALGPDLPLSRRDGGFVRAGHLAALDEARALRDESRRVIAALQARYAEETGVRTLRIKHNNVLGWFVEVAAAQEERFVTPPLNAVFVRRQTLAGQVRFSTVELADLEAKIATAADRALALEQEVFDDLVARVMAAAAALSGVADALGRLDVASSLAELAAARDWVRPEIDASLDFAITGGRHPVVEAALPPGAFVANDCDLSPPAGAGAGRIVLVTGPNMAGKSTWLRQNALMAVLAQAGSFVPARRARIGVVDRLFSRVGAADDLARGRSTFMVEMVETAAILNQAGERALVILDEIGRGTSTFDGLSIAWAAVEHLHETNRCRALFATHFHELTALSQRLGRLENATVRVKEWGGDVVFLHEVVPGAADRSYGIQVAKLAGLPASVLARAQKVLAELEAGDRASPARRVLDELPLFAATRPAPPPAPAIDPATAALLAALDGLDPDDMTPRAALDALFMLKAKRGKRP